MNRQEFTSTNSYPLSTQTMELLQTSIAAVAELSRIGGANYILSGCVQTGSTVSEGIIVINGEPMPFKGGAILSTITVIETAEEVKANGITYPRARISRYAQFASGTGNSYLHWASFRYLPTNQQLFASINTLSTSLSTLDTLVTSKLQPYVVPKGVITMWSGSISMIPKGWALCNGNNGTPNLQSRFVAGYDAEDNSQGYGALGYRGGHDFINLSTNQMPRHNHGIGDASKNVTAGEYGLIRKSKTGEQKTNQFLDTGGSGTEPDISTTPSGIPFEGKGTDIDIRPSYYVLAFIMKL